MNRDVILFYLRFGFVLSLAHQQIMLSETIRERADVVIRRHILEPGEALPWHTDVCPRFSVIIGGEVIAIEYRDSKEIKTIPAHIGLAEWDTPQTRVHRAINTRKIPYEEVIIFFIEKPGIEPQPEA